MKTEYVYADNAAATPTDERVTAVMQPYFSKYFANPSSLHSLGKAAEEAVSEARAKIASFINAKESEIYFTATGTESNNLALLGVAKASRNRGTHIITTQIEHPSLLNACRALEKDGFKVTYLPVNSNGVVEPSELDGAINSESILFATSYGNSEIGTLNDVVELGRVCHERGIHFHVDACQSAAYLPLDVKKFQATSLVFNGSKMYGPKGVAVLYLKEGTDIFPIVYGGGQQESVRSGTENVPGIIGLAEATELAVSRRESSKELEKLRDQLQQQVEKIANLRVNLSQSPRLSNHLSITFINPKANDLVKELDAEGVAVSAGSACSSRSLTESHVLTAIGLSAQEAQSTIRVSLGWQTTFTEVEKIASAIKKTAL